MANRGRPRKAGRRTKSGRLVAELRIVKGNDRAEERKAAYGTFGGDCLGRAYVKGLLGEGQLGKDRLDIARKYARIYTRVFVRPYRCALNDNPRGQSNADESDFEQSAEQWMRDNLALIDPADGPYFDQLVLPVSPLDDPHWLADLIAREDENRRRTLAKQKPLDDDNTLRAFRQILNAALRGIDALCQRPSARKRVWSSPLANKA